MPDVDDHGIGTPVAGQEVGDCLDRLLRCGKTNSDGRIMCESLQSLERNCQVGSALVVGDCVDFIHDHRFDITQDGPALFRSQQNVKRFWRRDQDVRRPLQHGAPLRHQGIPSADRGADLWHQQAALARHLQDFAQRNFEVLLNVVAQSLQRRHVQNFRAVLQLPSQSFAHQAINARQKSGQRFA